MADAFRVVTVEAFVGGASEFVVSQPSSDSLILSSTSLVVQEALLGAFLTEGLVKVELEGTTTVIRRVNLFEAGPGRLFPPSTLRVSRVATQRGPSGLDHLEVCLVSGDNPEETQYNVYDPMLQRLLMAAFQHRSLPGFGTIPIFVRAEGEKLVSVRLGEQILTPPH